MHLFSEIEVSHYFDVKRREVKQAVENTPNEQLDNQETFSQELLSKFQIEPLHLNFEAIYLSNREEQIRGEMHPRSEFSVERMRRQTFPRQVITFHLPYSGTSELFQCIPNPRLVAAPEVSVTDSEILVDVIDFVNDPDRVKRMADQTLDVIKEQALSLEANVKEYNTTLLSHIVKYIEQRRDRLQKQSNVLESLGYPVKAPEKVVTTKGQSVPTTTVTEHEWDVFISHASEDKDIFVRDLANELSKTLRVWYDEFTLKIGDSLRQSIDKGLSQSRYGIVVLSHNFFRKDWPQKELNGLATLERDGRKVILPIWLEIDKNEIIEYSPLLADRVAAKASNGLESVVAELLLVLKS